MSIRQGNKIIAGNVDNTNYTALLNKPQINSIELSGNKTLEELGIQASGDYATTEDTNEIKENYNKLDNQKTNCLTKIPQDIKLELSEDGTLTLKAGSKVYVPNGFEEDTTTKKFDIINIQEDISMTVIGDIENSAVYLNIEYNSLIYRSFDRLSSGTTDPQTPSTCYYNTASNKILDTSSAGAQSQVSLPIAQVVASGGKFTKIKQVFNGFGYIGSTIFSLPGVEGLIPNGRNIDGSLNNTKQVINNVSVYTIDDIVTGEFVLQINKTGLGVVNLSWYKEVNTLPSYTSLSGWSVYYLIPENFMYLGNGTTDWSIQESMICGSFTCENGRITSFSPNNTFQAVDRNDIEWASTQSKPSARYIDLTPGVSSSTYTAPANGWFGAITQNSSMCNLHKNQLNENFCVYNMESNVISDRASYIPVNKGDNITFYYNGSVLQFRFYYDEGTK